MALPGSAMTVQDRRGAMAVLLVIAAVVIVTISIRLALSDGPEFVAGMLIGVPLGALLGWLADQAIPRLVDRYLDRLRGR